MLRDPLVSPEERPPSTSRHSRLCMGGEENNNSYHDRLASPEKRPPSTCLKAPVGPLFETKKDLATQGDKEAYQPVCSC